MADPFVAEIRIFPFNFAPKGWAFCDGQLLPLSQNTALFSLLGTTYGGNGKSNFALPNLQGCVPIQAGQGPGLSLYDLGQTGGTETVTLLPSEMPAHSHPVRVQSAEGSSHEPANNYGAAANAPNVQPYTTDSNPQHLATAAAPTINPTGGDQPHNNLQPYLVLNYCIALQGVFPPRT
jgi:microcystin-dependent protein